MKKDPLRNRIPQRRNWPSGIRKAAFPLKRFFNTSGNLYKELGLKDKLPQMTEEEQLELLASDGMLVKRPLAVTDQWAFPVFGKRSGRIIWQTEL